MTNNELQSIKDQKQKFVELRKQIVGDSCKEISEKSKIYKEAKKEGQFINAYTGETESAEVLRNPSIRQRVLSDLDWEGFNVEDKGTNYIASLITILYHERKLHRRGDIDTKDYFDLSKWDNEHYGMLGATKEHVVNAILSSVGKNDDINVPFEELIYNYADDYGYYGADRDDEKRKAYSKKSKQQVSMYK